MFVPQEPRGNYFNPTVCRSSHVQNKNKLENDKKVLANFVEVQKKILDKGPFQSCNNTCCNTWLELKEKHDRDIILVAGADVSNG